MRKWPPLRLLWGWGRVLGCYLVDLEEVGIHARFGQLGLSSLGFRGQSVICWKLGGQLGFSPLYCLNGMSICLFQLILSTFLYSIHASQDKNTVSFDYYEKSFHQKSIFSIKMSRNCEICDKCFSTLHEPRCMKVAILVNYVKNRVWSWVWRYMLKSFIYRRILWAYHAEQLFRIATFLSLQILWPQK